MPWSDSERPRSAMAADCPDRAPHLRPATIMITTHSGPACGLSELSVTRGDPSIWRDRERPRAGSSWPAQRSPGRKRRRGLWPTVWICMHEAVRAAGPSRPYKAGSGGSPGGHAHGGRDRLCQCCRSALGTSRRRGNGGRCCPSRGLVGTPPAIRTAAVLGDPTYRDAHATCAATSKRPRGRRRGTRAPRM